jgi:hypothetical protein
MGHQATVERGGLQDAQVVGSPEREAQVMGDAVADSQRSSDFERVAQADYHPEIWDQLAPERQRQTGPRVLPAPDRLVAECAHQLLGLLSPR